jgi:hypothetical protein
LLDSRLAGRLGRDIGIGLDVLDLLQDLGELLVVRKFVVPDVTVRRTESNRGKADSASAFALTDDLVDSLFDRCEVRDANRHATALLIPVRRDGVQVVRSAVVAEEFAFDDRVLDVAEPGLDRLVDLAGAVVPVAPRYAVSLRRSRADRLVDDAETWDEAGIVELDRPTR